MLATPDQSTDGSSRARPPRAERGPDGGGRSRRRPGPRSTDRAAPMPRSRRARRVVRALRGRSRTPRAGFSIRILRASCSGTPIHPERALHRLLGDGPDASRSAGSRHRTSWCRRRARSASRTRCARVANSRRSSSRPSTRVGSFFIVGSRPIIRANSIQSLRAREPVHEAERAGDPVDHRLDERVPQVREPLEHTADHQLPHRTTREERLLERDGHDRGEARRVVLGQPAARRAGRSAGRRLGSRPTRGRASRRRSRSRRAGARASTMPIEPVLLRPVDVGDRLVDVVERDQRLAGAPPGRLRRRSRRASGCTPTRPRARARGRRTRRRPGTATFTNGNPFGNSTSAATPCASRCPSAEPGVPLRFVGQLGVLVAGVGHALHRARPTRRTRRGTAVRCSRGSPHATPSRGRRRDHCELAHRLPPIVRVESSQRTGTKPRLPRARRPRPTTAREGWRSTMGLVDRSPRRDPSAPGSAWTASPWPLVGRAAELEVLERTLRESAGAVVAGAPGVGKTRLLREAEARRVSQRCARRTHRRQPVGGFDSARRVRACSTRRHREALPASTRSARSGGSSCGEPTARRSCSSSTTRMRSTRTSAALVHQLGGRGRRTGARGNAVPRAGTRRDRRALEGRPLRTYRAPTAFTSRGRELLASVLDGPVEAATAHALWDASRGNVMFLRELVRSGLDSDALAVRQGLWSWPGPRRIAPRLAELLAENLAALDEHEREVLVVLALGEPLDWDVLVNLTSADSGGSARDEAPR